MKMVIYVHCGNIATGGQIASCRDIAITAQLENGLDLFFAGVAS